MRAGQIQLQWPGLRVQPVSIVDHCTMEHLIDRIAILDKHFAMEQPHVEESSNC